MSDRGFSIQEFCASRGTNLSKPKQKENDQIMEVDVATNFDIAATRFYVHVTGGILNSLWPINSMDILSSAREALAHIVNLTNPPIEPKE